MDTRRSGCKLLLCRSKRGKYPAWGVRPQGWNPKKLTGTRTSSGACGLIRSNAKNLTKTWHCMKGAEMHFPSGIRTGGAWLSSARVVRCSVKSGNERNPCDMLASFSWQLISDCRGQHGGRRGRRQIIMPLTSWATHVLQWALQTEARPQGGANLIKAFSVRIEGWNPPSWSRSC